MHVISRKALVDFGADHAEAVEPLDRWYRVARKATWANFAEVRADFGSADQVGDHTIFNIAGNKFRLVALIFHNQQVLLVRGVYTHKDYDKLDF
jgi:mRNA interferase HigB